MRRTAKGAQVKRPTKPTVNPISTYRPPEPKEPTALRILIDILKMADEYVKPEVNVSHLSESEILTILEAVAYLGYYGEYGSDYTKRKMLWVKKQN